MSKFKIISIEELIKTLDKYNYKQLHIHHTWKPTHRSFNGSNHIALQENMRNFHINSNGWSDIGQHITNMPDGKIVTGRDFGRNPASISGHNTGAFMVENLGNFDDSSSGEYNDLGYDKLEGDQKETLLKIIKYFIDKIGEENILFHREKSSKTCPGTSINKKELLDEAKGIKSQTNILIKYGSRGDHVKRLQSDLSSLGIDTGTIDGIAGNNTIRAIEHFQYKYGLVVDGLFGSNSYKKLSEVLDIGKATFKSEYMEIGNVKVIKTRPDNIEIKILGNTLHQAGVYGVNGTFFNMREYNLPRACWGIATNEGKAIGGNSMLVSYDRKVKKGIIIYFEDGSMGMAKVNNINEFWKPHIWSISGYTVLPYMDFKGESMPSGINYKTAHTYLGFDKDNNIYMIVKPNHMISEIVPLLKQLGLTRCIVLDGGGSSQLNHIRGNYKSSRKVNSIVALKEI